RNLYRSVTYSDIPVLFLSRFSSQHERFRLASSQHASPAADTSAIKRTRRLTDTVSGDLCVYEEPLYPSVHWVRIGRRADADPRLARRGPVPAAPAERPRHR